MKARVPGSQRRTVLNTLMEGRSPLFSKKDGSQGIPVLNTLIAGRGRGFSKKDGSSDITVLNTLLLQGVFVFRETVLILFTEPVLKFSEPVLLFWGNVCLGLVMLPSVYKHQTLCWLRWHVL